MPVYRLLLPLCMRIRTCSASILNHALLSHLFTDSPFSNPRNGAGAAENGAVKLYNLNGIRYYHGVQL